MIETINPADLQAAAITIGSFLLVGAGANYVQYQHKVETTPEEWHLSRALPTLGVGALGGLVAWALGLPPEVAAVSGVLGGLVPIADEVRSSSLSFRETYSIARKGGDSPAASATRGAEAAMNDVDTSRVRAGVDEIRKASEESGGYYGDPEAIAEGIEDEQRRQFLGLGAPTDESESEQGADEVVTDGP